MVPDVIGGPVPRRLRVWVSPCEREGLVLGVRVAAPGGGPLRAVDLYMLAALFASLVLFRTQGNRSWAPARALSHEQSGAAYG